MGEEFPERLEMGDGPFDSPDPATPSERREWTIAVCPDCKKFTTPFESSYGAGGWCHCEGQRTYELIRVVEASALAAAETRAAEAEEEARIAKHNYDQIMPMIDNFEKRCVSAEHSLQQAREALELFMAATEKHSHFAWVASARKAGRTALETPRGEGE